MSKEVSASSSRIKDLDKKIKAFKNYKRRTEVIHEVIEDQRLLAENPKWNLNFVVDFYQVYGIAFPPVVKASPKVQGREINVELTFPTEKEKSKIFRNRLSKSIPFFGLSRVERYPILIEPYQEELEISMKNQVEKLLRKKLQEVIFDKRQDIKEIKEKWVNIVNNLNEAIKSPKPEAENDQEIKKLVDEFSKLTIESFYILLLMNAASGTKIIKLLLTDSDPERGKRLRRLPKHESVSQLIAESDFLPWLEILNEYRFKTFSNIIDAKAIATVLKLNEIANKDKRKDVYLFVSDAENIKFALKETNDLRDKKISPRIYNYTLRDGLNILRTSYHFEEYMMAYDDVLKVQIEKLKERKEDLIKEIEVISPQIDEMSKECKKDPQQCPCDLQERCDELKEKIGHFFKTEEEKTNLSSIIEKQTIFEPLLKFTKKFIQKNLDKEIPEIKELEKVYTNFFFKDYSNNMSTQLKRILNEYEDEYFENISAIVKTISTAESSIMTTMNSLKKMEGIIYNIAFENNDRIRNLMNKVFSKRSKNIEEQVKMDREWYQEVYKAIHENKDTVEGTLLAMILLFCNESFDDSWWLADYWLKNKSEEIKKSDKLVEFNFILRLSAAWIEYSKKDRFYKMNLKDIVNRLIKFWENHPKDPRIPYLIGKLIGLKFQFDIQIEDVVLKEAIDYFRKALNLLDALKKESNLYFEEIRLPIENNILWCIIHLKEASKSILDEVEALYNVIITYKTRPQRIETCASYNYLKAKNMYPKDKDKSSEFFTEALYLLLYAIKLGKTERNVNRREMDILEKEFDTWKTEYKDRYEDKFLSLKQVLNKIETRINKELFQ